MSREDEMRLRHMADAAREAASFAAGRTRGDLDDGRQLVMALVKEIEIVGEAAEGGRRAPECERSPAIRRRW